MKHIKKFNESTESTIEDNLYLFFDKEPTFKDENDNWSYYEYSKGSFNIDRIENYLNGPRFKGYHCNEYLSTHIAILIVKEEFWKENQNIIIDNLKWEDHPLKSIKLEWEDVPGIQNFANFADSKKVNNLPNSCSLIKNVGTNNRIEFWPQNSEGDPINIKNDESGEFFLQYLLFKHATKPYLHW